MQFQRIIQKYIHARTHTHKQTNTIFDAASVAKKRDQLKEKRLSTKRGDIGVQCMQPCKVFLN